MFDPLNLMLLMHYKSTVLGMKERENEQVNFENGFILKNPTFQIPQHLFFFSLTIFSFLLYEQSKHHQW